MSIENRISALKKKHEAVDNEIRSLELRPGADELSIAALKRQKLALKDELSNLERAPLAG